jgi:hypothetical protein
MSSLGPPVEGKSLYIGGLYRAGWDSATCGEDRHSVAATASGPDMTRLRGFLHSSGSHLRPARGRIHTIFILISCRAAIVAPNGKRFFMAGSRYKFWRTCYHSSMNRLSKWEIFYSFLIILPMAAAMTIGDYILRKRATGND